ncbi:MAG TPA: VOC family protein [Acidimicrobiales bacterium]|nr:VOC family protein [Acidimicrobiales bacterium]
MPTITGGHHVAFTVSDADRSARWYEDLLGMQVVLDGDDETVRFRVLAHPESGWVVGVRQYHGREGGPFDEFRTGMDHFAFAVSSRAELEAWEERLSEMGAPFTPIAVTPIGSVIVFRDPDNIQLEFWLPPGK